jgi:hypothetical protein
MGPVASAGLAGAMLVGLTSAGLSPPGLEAAAWWRAWCETAVCRAHMPGRLLSEMDRRH